MMLTLSRLVLLLAAVGAALMAGLFYSWSVSVTPGIGRLQDAAYLKAFQEMNRAILNPAFLTCFMGTALMLPLATALHFNDPARVRFWLLLGATLCYLIGVLGVTMAGNVPMNNALDAFPVETASVQELARQRATFEVPWNRLNMIRTICATLAVLLVTIACLWREER